MAVRKTVRFCELLSIFISKDDTEQYREQNFALSDGYV